jgi:orotidine-5'-phosphate decarboxylase
MEANIALAADKLTLEQCLELGRKIGERLYCIKVHNLVDEHGPGCIEELRRHYKRVWVDAKLHDIPETVRLRAQSLKNAGAEIISVHAEGGIEMMVAAKECGASIFAISALTSLGPEEVELVSGHSASATVLYRAQMAQLAGVFGIVCSPQEVGTLNKRNELSLVLVTPGIREDDASLDDQKRVGTAVWTLQQGSDILVIGRELTTARDPIVAFEKLDTRISAAGY